MIRLHQRILVQFYFLAFFTIKIAILTLGYNIIAQLQGKYLIPYFFELFLKYKKYPRTNVATGSAILKNRFLGDWIRCFR